MCGRYTVITKLQEIEKRFNVSAPPEATDAPVANMVPGSRAPVIASNKPDALQYFQFGLCPAWSKKRMLLINARSEGDLNKSNDRAYHGAKGIIQKPSFRKPIRSQRCLVVADAFIEGPEKEKLNKPYLIYHKAQERPFAFAGIWDEWADPATGELIPGFSIITTVANSITAAVGHHRSPVILSRDDEQRWLDPQLALDEVTELLEPFDGRAYNAYPISSAIKSPSMQDLAILSPVGERVFPEYEYSFSQEWGLTGMGESRARTRKMNEGEQGSLF